MSFVPFVVKSKLSHYPNSRELCILPRMASKFMQLVLTPAVQAAQERYFGKHQSVAGAPARDPFTGDEAAFIASRDSF